MELSRKNIYIHSISVTNESIEDYFLRLTGGVIMLKVIKMDLYRMFKSKYTYIVLAAAMLMIVCFLFL